MTVPVTPRPGATVMLLRETETPRDPGFEVLLVRRSDRAAFVPGAHVFPGGVVDESDADLAYADHLDEVPDDLAYRVASVRECLEEAGVLLARTADDQPLPRAHPVLADLHGLRAQVERGSVRLSALCARHRVRLAVDRLVYVARWITPEESPRRYDTRFYAAAMPAGQEARADDREVGDARWWHPARALDAWQAGEIHLIEPTVESLRSLATHDTVDAALDALRAAGPAPTDTLA